MTQSQATTTHTVLCSDTAHHTHSSNSSSTVLPASLSAVNLRKWTLVGLTEASISAVGLRAVAGAHCLSPGYPSSRPWWLPWRRDPTLIPGGSELPLSICDRSHKQNTSFHNIGNIAKHPFSKFSLRSLSLSGKERLSHFLLKQLAIRRDEWHVLMHLENMS